MTPENLKQELVNSWAQIEGYLPSGFDPHNKRFVRQYFRAQWRIAKGQKVRAREILRGLDDATGFREFEKRNESLLAAIDIAVTGSSNREDDFGDKIEPLFRISR